MAQDIKDASRLAKKVLDCACGKESLTQEEAAYLKKLDENDETIVDELFIRSLLEALLKLEKFKVSKKRHENVSKGPQKLTVQQRELFELFIAHENCVRECGEHLKTAALSTETVEYEANESKSNNAGDLQSSCSDLRVSLLKIARYCSEHYLDSSLGESWLEKCFFKVLELEKAWLEIFLLHADYFSRWISECGVPIIVSKLCQRKGPQEELCYGDGGDMSVLLLLLTKFVSRHGTSSQKSFIFSVVERSIRRQLSHLLAKCAVDDKSFFISLVRIIFAVRTVSHLIMALEVLEKAETAYTLLFHFFDSLSSIDNVLVISEDFISLEVMWLHELNEMAAKKSSLVELSHAIAPLGEQRRFSVITYNVLSQYKVLLAYICQNTNVSINMIKDLIDELVLFIGVCYLTDENCLNQMTRHPGGVKYVFVEMYSATLQEWKDLDVSSQSFCALLDLLDCLCISVIKFLKETFVSSRWIVRDVHFTATAAIISGYLRVLNETSSLRDGRINWIALRHKCMILQVFEFMGRQEISRLFSKENLLEEIFLGNFTSELDEQLKFLDTFRSFLRVCIASSSDDYCHSVLELLLRTLISAKIVMGDDCVILDESSDRLITNVDFLDGALDIYISALTVCSSSVHEKLVQVENIYVVSNGILHLEEEKSVLAECSHRERIASLSRKLLVVLKIFFSNEMAPFTSLYSDRIWKIFIRFLEKEETGDLGKDLLRRIFLAADERENSFVRSKDFTLLETRKHCLLLFQALLERLEQLCFQQSLNVDERSRVLQKYLSLFSILVTESKLLLQKMFRKTRGFDVVKYIFANGDSSLLRIIGIDLLKLLSQLIRNDSKAELQFRSLFTADFLVQTLHSCYPEGISAEIVAALLEMVMGNSVLARYGYEDADDAISFVVESNILSSRERLAFGHRIASSCSQVLYVLFKLIDSTSVEIQVALCNFLYAITHEDSLNASVVDASGVTQIIIDCLFETPVDSVCWSNSHLRNAYLSCLCAIIRRVVTPPTLSRLFAVTYLLHSSDLSLHYKSMVSNGQVTIFRNLCDSFEICKKWPRWFFDFSGNHSGLVSILSGVDLTRRKDSLWLTFWFQREPLYRESSIFQLYSSNDIAIEMFLNELGIICWRMHESQTVLDTFHNTDIEVPPNAWVFFCIRFQRVSSGKQTVIDIYLDGKHSSSGNLSKNVDRIAAIGFGCSFVWMDNTKVIHRTTSCLKGQFGAIYCYQGTLSEQTISTLHQLGPSFDSDLLEASLSDSAKELEELSNLSVLFLYAPRCCGNSRICPNSSSTVVGARKLLTAKLIGSSGDSRVCSVNNIVDSLHCIGGSKMVLELLFALDNVNTSIVEEGEMKGNIVFPDSKSLNELACYCLNIISSIMHYDKLCETEFMFTSIFEYLGAWFYDTGLVFSSKELIAAIFRLLEVCCTGNSLVSLFTEHCLSNEFLWNKMTQEVAIYFWETMCSLRNNSLYDVHNLLEIIANFDVDSAVFVSQESRDMKLFRPLVDYIFYGFQLLVTESERLASGDEVLVIGGTSKKFGVSDFDQIERSYSRALIENLMKSVCFRLMAENDPEQLEKLDYLIRWLSSFSDSLSASDRSRCFSLLIQQNVIDVLLKSLSSFSQLSLVYLSMGQLFDLFESNCEDFVQWMTSQFVLSEVCGNMEKDEWKLCIVGGLCLFTARILHLRGVETDLFVLLEYLTSSECLSVTWSLHLTNEKLRTGLLPLIFIILVKETDLIRRASMIQALTALLEEKKVLTKAFLRFNLWSFWIIKLFQVEDSSMCNKEEPFRSCIASCKKLVALFFKQIIEDHGMSLATIYYVEDLVFAAWSCLDVHFAIQVLMWFLQSVKDIAVPLLLSRGLFGMNVGSKSSQSLETSEGLAMLFLFTELICHIDKEQNQEETGREDFKSQLYENCVEVIFLLGLLNTSPASFSGETKQVSSDFEISGGYIFPKSVVSELFRKFENDRSFVGESSSPKSFKLDEQTFIEPICKAGFVRISLLFIMELIVEKRKRNDDPSYYESLVASIGEFHGGLRVDKIWRHYVEQYLTGLLYDSIASQSLTTEGRKNWQSEVEVLLGNLSNKWKQTTSTVGRKSFGFLRPMRSKSFHKGGDQSSSAGNEVITSLMKKEQEWRETGCACMFSALMNWKSRNNYSMHLLERISSELSSKVCMKPEEQEVVASDGVKREAKVRLKASEWRKIVFGFRKQLNYQKMLKNSTSIHWSLAGIMDTLQRRWLLKPAGNTDTQRMKLNESANQLSSPSKVATSEIMTASHEEVESSVAQEQLKKESTNITGPHLSLPVEDPSTLQSEEKNYDWSVESPEPASASSSASTPLLSNVELLAARTAASASDVQWSGTCIWVHYLEAIPGRLELRERSIRFLESPFNEESEKVLSPGYFVRTPSTEEDVISMQELNFPLEDVQHLEFRRFLLQHKAFEIFLRGNKSYFFAFQTSRACKTCLKLLSKLLDLPYNRPAPSHNTGGPRSVYAGGAFRFPRCILDWKTVQSLVADACARWKRRQLSNFEYLCILNRLAGRSNNDLCQYPIFPWILADYSTPELDLTDPKTFRDLSKPIGCQPSSNSSDRDERERLFRERFGSWADQSIPPFHYGSHYSSAASTLHYLVRVEPFTTLSLQLQGGLFDHPDRMFYSVHGAWNSVTQSMQDVKELIPEFFYFPEIFRNRNGINFGQTQDGHSINDVILPNWANNSPEHFVRVHREALESEYVSLNLHRWIDLIFGFRQRGPAAVEACNVFFYLTYEGAVDLESIQDMELRESMETQIAHFGQTPPQLLQDSSHPQRDHSGVAFQPSYWTPEGLSTALEFSVAIGTDDSIIQICQAGERILSITKKQQVFRHKWMPLPDLQGSPFTLETETKNIAETGGVSTQESNVEARSTTTTKASSRGGEEIVGGTFTASTLSRLYSLYALTYDGKVIISAGHWDWSIRCCFTAEAHKPIQYLKRHRDVVTCLVIGSDGRTLVTGSKDTTIFVWEIVWGDPERGKEQFQGGKMERSSSKGESKLGALLKGQGNVSRKRKTRVVEERPKLVLYEHEYPLVCVAVNTEVGVIASNDAGNCLMIHNASNGHLLRILDFSKDIMIDSVTITCRNEVIMISSREASCTLYTGNGVFLKKQKFCSQENQAQSTPTITSYTTTVDGRLLFVADELSGVGVYSTWDLNLLHRYQPCPSSPVSALCLTAEESILLAGLADGRILAYAVDRYALLQMSSLFGVQGASNPFYGC